jgi:hypothetical protein
MQYKFTFFPERYFWAETRLPYELLISYPSNEIHLGLHFRDPWFMSSKHVDMSSNTLNIILFYYFCSYFFFIYSLLYSVFPTLLLFVSLLSYSLLFILFSPFFLNHLYSLWCILVTEVSTKFDAVTKPTRSCDSDYFDVIKINNVLNCALGV